MLYAVFFWKVQHSFEQSLISLVHIYLQNECSSLKDVLQHVQNIFEKR